MGRLALFLLFGSLLTLFVYRIIHGKEETLLLLKRFAYLLVGALAAVGMIFLSSVEEVRKFLYWVGNIFG